MRRSLFVRIRTGAPSLISATAPLEYRTVEKLSDVGMDLPQFGSVSFGHSQLCKTINFRFFVHLTLMLWAFTCFSCKI